MQEIPDLNEVKLNRREFLGHAFKAVTDKSYLASLILPQEQESYEEQITEFPFELYPAEPSELIFHENSFFEIDPIEHRVDLPGMGWYPDGRIPFITQEDGSKLMWISGIVNGVQGSYPYTWSPTEGLNRYVGSNGFAPSVSREQYDQTQYYKNGYCGLTSVLRMKNGILGFTHNEQWGPTTGGAGFRASVGLVFSKDGGQTFQQAAGAPVLGRSTLYPGSEVTGAGQPCAIFVDDKNSDHNYAYIYYTEWLPRNFSAPNQIYLAKLEIFPDGIGMVENWTYTGFRNTLYAKNVPQFRPVIPYPSYIGNSNYSALASVTFNTVRQKLLAVFETNIGVCACESTNGLDWGTAELIAEYPTPLSSVWSNPGTTGYSYPSVVDFSENSDNLTRENLTMFLAKGIGSNSSHSMVALKLKTKS
jgi:hypothetical protein